MGPEWVWWRFQPCFNKEGKLVFTWFAFQFSQYSYGQKKSCVGT